LEHGKTRSGVRNGTVPAWPVPLEIREGGERRRALAQGFDEQPLGMPGLTRGTVAPDSGEGSLDHGAEGTCAAHELGLWETPQPPVPERELEACEGAADRLVVAHEALLLAVEREGGLLTRRRWRLHLPLAVVAACCEEDRGQEHAGAPVDSAAMKVLVTGASGFVGRALYDELRHAEGAYEVHSLGRAAGDLAQDGVAEAAVAAAKPDIVVHAAARIGVVRCENEPELALRSNVLATVMVARAAVAHGARLAYVSTSDVYGSAAVADEETPPAPESLYAHTKLWGEHAAALYAPAAVAVLRLANPYGPGVDTGQGKGALTTMLHQAGARERIPVFRGEARTWCWIGDVVRAIRLVLESEEEGTFNVGSDGEPVALADTARLACELTGAPQELIEEVEPPPGRVMTRISIERLRGLGWRPEISLDEGMRRLLESLRAGAPV
jgi:nucleoside-diphosphate-sugar epimerase